MVYCSSQSSLTFSRSHLKLSSNALSCSSLNLLDCTTSKTMGCMYTKKILPYSRVVTPPSLLRPPPPLQREVTAKGHFLLPYTPPPPPPPPPHLHMHTCVWLALTSMFTLVLRCYYVVIFAKCVRWFPCGRLRTCGTGLWQRYCCVGSGGVTTPRCMQFSLLRPPPLFSAKLRFKRGGVTTREYGNSYIRTLPNNTYLQWKHYLPYSVNGWKWDWQLEDPRPLRSLSKLLL